ncbi:YeeE/YedE family protein [Serratia microhaemolytica]|uniref:YeeE/YedE family protein n=1 Tax=Serratia microhaemolytica TaxID=2675110 RepID=UPI000FDE6260|nr:YeeE/YedE family protein [Serratia microhaemolytica]
MTIDTLQFTPLLSFIGGLLIGAAASILLLFCGRIAGISGILGGLLSLQTSDRAWRIAFLLGLVLSPMVYALFRPLPSSEINTSWPIIIVAGLLVGLGTRYGSGCTSGHGVCGLSRLSLRSLVATGVFMTAAFVTVWLMGAIA